MAMRTAKPGEEPRVDSSNWRLTRRNVWNGTPGAGYQTFLPYEAAFSGYTKAPTAGSAFNCAHFVPFAHPLLAPQYIPDKSWHGLRRTTAPIGLVLPRYTTVAWDRLYDMIDAGVGGSVGENYCAWIRIRRRLSSPVSTLHVEHTPLYSHRSLHLLSDEEDRMARIFVWLGVTEVREQMPMWPDPHRLPLLGWHLDRDRSLGDAPGLLEIAKKAGINHGRYWATKIPFIATTDLMVRFGIPPNDRLILCQCKPRKLAEAPENGRKRERLVLETLYAQAIGAYSIVIHEDYLPIVFHENLSWLEPLRSEFLIAQASQQIFDFAHAFMRRCDSDPIEACVEYAASRTKMDRLAGHASFRMAAWAGLIDLDLLQPIQLTRLLRRDGGRLRAQITQELLCPA